jgi:hypothetical protein
VNRLGPIDAAATPEEAAAVIGALEQFLRDTLAPGLAPDARPDPWLRAARLEAVGLDPWDDRHPW